MASILANDLPELKNKLINSIKIVSVKNKPRLMDYEVALKNAIEEFYPERYWWEVTQCEIHEELFKKDGLYNIVNKIMSKITLCD